MTAASDPGRRTLARASARARGLPLREGVYAAVTGPNLETAAEYRMLRLLGADVVGMSPAPEVIADPHVAARHMLVEMPRTDDVDEPVLIPGNPVKLSNMAEGPETRVPWVGEHTDQVLRAELGLDDDRLAALRAEQRKKPHPGLEDIGIGGKSARCQLCRENEGLQQQLAASKQALGKAAAKQEEVAKRLHNEAGARKQAEAP